MLPHNSDQTNLSADVAPFVPRKEFQNDSGYVEQGPNPLPRYVTTCYPFVQEQQNGRVPIQPVGSQFVPVSYIGDSTSIHPPPVPTPHNPIVVGMVPPNAGYSAPGGDGIPLLFNNVVHQSVPNHMSTANSTPKHRNIEKSSKRVSRKNVATQNESTTANENNFSADVQMVDSCQQTDFPVAIASKSLTERPSPLKKTRNRRHRSSMLVNSDDRESSSDHADADIDSDSGYYSPKHRMVQKRSGGTSTSELTSGFHQNRLTGGNTTPVSRVVYLAPSPALYQVQAPLSQQVMSGMLSPHPTPPPSLLLTPPGTPLLSQSPVISRPPPGFPPPPNYLKPQWSGPLFLNNHPQFAGTNLNPHMVPTNQFYPGNNPQFSQRGRNRRPNYSPKHRWQAPQQFPTNSVPTSQFSGSDNSYDKRKQDRRKVTMQELFHDHRAFANGVSIPTQDTNSGILLSDTQEFPGLGSPSMINQSMLVGSQLSYSDAVLGKTIIHQSPQTVQLTARNSASPDDGSVQEKLQAQKNRKRQKKAERASKAADEEYAEISEEQENIKKALKKTAANRNRNKPSKFDLGEILSQQLKSKTMSGKIEMSGANMKDGSSLSNLKLRSTLAMPVNPLDSTAPMVKRGKERENPKPKKPSALKKVILKEREEKKEHRLSQLTTRDLPDTDVPPYPPAILDTLKSQSHEEEIDHSVIENIGSSVPQIHSRRYREYCSQVLDKRIDETCTIILQKLVQFQDRLYQKDPMKAKMRRRLVMGIREVTKHLKLKKLKCVIVSPNLEKIQSKGGLDDALQQILDMCESQNVTYVFALGRKAMGRAVSKLVPVSIVGIFDYSGAEDQYKEMCSLVIEAQQKYKEMVSIYQQEVIDATNTTPTTTAVTTGGTSKRFPHMGHSRNPSAASCVSFASFISEPISEMNEGSNWRAMMDAQEEQTTLSPPPEVESDEEPTSSKMSTGGVANTNQHEDLCRKDSGSTVVECKDAQHPEETDELPEDLEIVHDLSSSLSSIHEEASTSASKNLDKSFSNSSTVVVLPRAEVPPIGAQSDDLCAEKPIDEASEVQNRIQMWLENASRSVQDMNLDLTPPEEENGPEEISSPEEDLIKDEPQEKGDEIEEQ